MKRLDNYSQIMQVSNNYTDSSLRANYTLHIKFHGAFNRELKGQRDMPLKNRTKGLFDSDLWCHAV